MLIGSQERGRRLVWARLVVGATLVGVCALASGEVPSRCEPPKALSEKLDQLYPGYSVITAHALPKGHRSKYRADHGKSCPGLVKLDFYGSGLSTYGVALIKREDKKVLTKLLVATQSDRNWAIVEIDSATLTTPPVIWTEPPGEYKDVYGQKAIRARYPVLLFVGYESWGIVFSWSGTEVQKLWVSD